MSPLQPLLDIYKKITLLGSINAVLGWDQETYMPSGAIQFRAQQSAFLSELSHQLLSGPEFKSALEPLIELTSGAILPDITDPIERQMVYYAYREWKVATALPSTLVTALSETTSLAQHEWQTARRLNEFNRFYPILDQVVQLTLQKVEAIGYTESPYDALLDPFEPGMTVKQLTPLFADLKRVTAEALQRCATHPNPRASSVINYESSRQRLISDDLLPRMGFDLSRGRLDQSTHPFSSAFHPTDSRITTRFNPNDLMDNISSTLHEAGHGLYEQGLPLQYFGTPVGTSMSLGIHESQSRLWENIVGKSPEFWEGYFPIISGQFPEIAHLGWQEFYSQITAITPSLIRVDADEITYNSHIMVRYDLEQLLFSGAIKTKDLPDAWNQKMTGYLGVTPPSDALGVLQDVHWSIGAFGYFPTYSLGNLYSAQFYEAAEHAIPDLKNQIKALNFIPLKNWLTQSIHQVGRTQTTEELVKTVTGVPLSVGAFERYLKKKYV